MAAAIILSMVLTRRARLPFLSTTLGSPKCGRVRRVVTWSPTARASDRWAGWPVPVICIRWRRAAANFYLPITCPGPVQTAPAERRTTARYGNHHCHLVGFARGLAGVLRAGHGGGAPVSFRKAAAGGPCPFHQRDQAALRPG